MSIRYSFIPLFALFFCLHAYSQRNITFTHPDFPDLLNGNYNSEDYQDENALNEPELIFEDLVCLLV